MNDYKDFDKIIKEKIGGMREMPPSHLWENISAEIRPIAAIPFYKEAYFKISLLIASIVIILAISWYVPQNTNYNNITSNTENFQNIKNYNINNLNSIDSIRENNKNNNSQNLEDRISIIKKTTFIEKEIIVDNKSKQIKYRQTEVKQDNISEIKINKISNSPKEIDIKFISTAIPTNNISQKTNVNNNIVSLKSETNTANIENKKSENNDSIDYKTENSREIIAIAIVETPKEIVKHRNNTSKNKEVIAQETINTEEKIITETSNEPIQAVVEKINENTNEIEEVIAQETINTEEDIITETSNESIQSVVENTNEIEELEPSKNLSETLSLENIDHTPDDKMPTSNFNPKNILYDKYSIGTHYGYEQISTGDLNVVSNNFDLSFNLQNVNFIAQTGIGFQISKDKNSYIQHYIRNEYLATQVRFDSLVFVADVNGEFTPIPVNSYYTDVYDSINYIHNDKTYETYYSIRIPLFIGYKKQLKYFDAFAQGGIIYSHVFKNNTGAMNKLDSESKMLKNEYLINERQNNQLQYVVTGGLSYGITKQLYLNAELMAKYYHYSIYKNTESNYNTWSYEARFGITYLLN